MELEIIRYCAEECDRQGSGELSVYNMCNAWELAQERMLNEPAEARIVDLDFIDWLGRLVEPTRNNKGYRTIPIYVGNKWEMVEKAPWDRVQPLLTALLESYYSNDLFPQSSPYEYDTSPARLAKTVEDIFYYEYENIHPFVDGNGRTGKILYNYLCGTLDNPKLPPNFWGSVNL